LQSALTEHALPLLSTQYKFWQRPPAQSVLTWQRAPLGALQVGAAHAFDLHWLSALQAVQTEFVQSPLAHRMSSVQAPPVWVWHLLAMQMPLAQVLSSPQAAPVGALHPPAASQTFVAPQAGSGCSTGALVQVPGEAGRLQDWQVPLQAVLQQTLSAQLPLTQLVPSRHVSPLHFLQLPPQSLPVSAPFWRPSEQLTQVCVTRSQEGVVPAVQSLSLAQPTHAPAASQTPAIPSHGLPAWIIAW
jgi:hypothetical protein